MVLDHLDPKPDPNDDESTVYTANTPPETVDADFLNDNDPLGGAKSGPLLVPWPGSTYIIRSVSSGHMITLLEGNVVLTQPGGRGAIQWKCVETKGWLGFQNTVSGKFLGHGRFDDLICKANHHMLWEWFSTRMKPDGGCILLMTHFERLWHVGIKQEHGGEKLAKIGDGGSGGILWEFIEV